LTHAGPWLAAAFVLAVSWSRLRLALFASFVILYFGGYPAIQFGVRHFFHLEFIGWAILAFLVERGIRLALRSRLEGTEAAPAREGVPRLVGCAVLLASVLLVPLAVLRSYQGGQVTRLLESYVRSPAEPLPLVGSAPGQFRVAAGDRGWLRPGTVADGPRNPETRFVQAVLNGAACRPGTTLTFRYDPARPDADFSHAVPLDGVARSGPTRVFEAVYDNFQGLDVSDSAPGCLQEVLVLTHLEQFPLLLPARLSPGWEGRPQYQRITFFGGARR
jgi:hypothetical protein